MTGIIAKLEENSVLVIEEKAKEPRAISVSISKAKIIDEKKGYLEKNQLKLGMEVEVWVTGAIAESYPEQAIGSKLIIKSQTNNTDSSISRATAVEKALRFSETIVDVPYIRKVQFNADLKQWTIEIGSLLEKERVIPVKINSDSGEVITK
ncbi:hypothetical protein SAMN04487970_10037 [Paenibacillus tianmuensis]|uniref:Uncharacterized protein n=1 Tax=Paenibacillus tianmuensis TaxID=624147 RepID=A0A1G4PK88_9BACL|nr:DUF3221 domain-containing protein [Paenibacillus tianmuensis]SCW32676.1 hypothetical protein SAMN04487970_10037 [Paenibacillus tianmuensis]